MTFNLNSIEVQLLKNSFGMSFITIRTPLIKASKESTSEITTRVLNYLRSEGFLDFQQPIGFRTLNVFGKQL